MKQNNPTELCGYSFNHIYHTNGPRMAKDPKHADFSGRSLVFYRKLTDFAVVESARGVHMGRRLR